MKVHIQEEEILSLTIGREGGRVCDIPAGLYNRYFLVIKSFEMMRSELQEYYTAGEMVSPAPPVRENTLADQIRSELLTELISPPEPEKAKVFVGIETPTIAPPKKRIGRPPKLKPQPANEPA